MKKSIIYIIILSLYGVAEFYTFWSHQTSQNQFENILIADIDEPFSEEGLYLAKGTITAKKYATIPNIISQDKKLLAIDLKVEVFQLVEIQDESEKQIKTYHYEKRWVEKDDFEWEKSKKWNDKSLINPNYKTWPIPISSNLIFAEGFLFKENHTLDDDVLKHYFEFGGDRTAANMFRVIDFDVPKYLNKNIDTLHAGYYFGNNSTIKNGEVGDVKITLHAFCSELRENIIVSPKVYNLFGNYNKISGFEAVDNHYYVTRNKSLSTYKEQVLQYEKNASSTFIWLIRIIMTTLTIGFIYYYIKNKQ